MNPEEAWLERLPQSDRPKAERLLQTIAHQEDALFRSTRNIIGLADDLERLSKVLADCQSAIAGPPGSPWDAANAATDAAHRAKAALVQDLTAQKKSIAKIHQLTGLSTRHISRLRTVKL